MKIHFEFTHFLPVGLRPALINIKIWIRHKRFNGFAQKIIFVSNEYVATQWLRAFVLTGG